MARPLEQGIKGNKDVAKMGQTIFISHSHSDRDEALRLQDLIEANGAKTFLDQDEISGGDTLPKAIRDGIARCDKFLLIWSAAAADSEWVEKEWGAAFEMKKRIIPYIIDSSTLPDALENFVHITQDDEERGNAELLRAVFGRVLEAPKGVDMFPGYWVATIEMPDGSKNEMVYKLELRSNGQVSGVTQAKKTGMLGVTHELLRQHGFDYGIMFQPYPVHGKWSYKPGSGLKLNLIYSAFGKKMPVDIEVHTSGKKENVLHGMGPGATKWTLRRRGKK